MNQTPLINVMSAAAIKAGKGLVRDFGEIDQLQVSRKGTANFVTQSDVRTEKLLQRELSKARPDFGFLLEEGGEVPGKDGAHRWVIDPLDGTSNFIHAIPYFCISIGLEKKTKDGSEIIAGVIFDPIHNELFAAEKGNGAFLNNRRLATSARGNFEEALLATNSFRIALEQHSDKPTLFDALSRQNATIRNFGATALDLAYVAAGRLDACWYYTLKPWDIAAGMLLIMEAGGVVTDMAGAPISPGSATLLASNQPLAQPLKKLLA